MAGIQATQSDEVAEWPGSRSRRKTGGSDGLDQRWSGWQTLAGQGDDERSCAAQGVGHQGGQVPGGEGGNLGVHGNEGSEGT